MKYIMINNQKNVISCFHIRYNIYDMTILFKHANGISKNGYYIFHIVLHHIFITNHMIKYMADALLNHMIRYCIMIQYNLKSTYTILYCII